METTMDIPRCRAKRASFCSMVFAFLLLAFNAPLSHAQQDDFAALTKEAYLYGLPLIMSYKTLYFYSGNPASPEYKAPFNQISNTARVYGPKDTAVVSPNSDTPYSLLWLDLRAEPVVLCVPEIEPDRYFSVMLQDLSTYLLPYIGTRTTGNDGGCFMVAASNWSGHAPDGVSQVMRSATDYVFAVYRTQLFNAADLDQVIAVQQGYAVSTLSAYAGTDAPQAAPAVDFPAWDEEAATGGDFIRYLNFLLQFVRPDETERALLDRLAAIGVGPGLAFDRAQRSQAELDAIDAGVAAAKAAIDKRLGNIALAGNTAKGYDHNWLDRAAVTQLGWGANVAEEASYPNYRVDAQGNPLDAGTANYTLTFPADGQPPVRSFWSLTLYDGNTMGMIDNPLDRYLINSPMLPDLKLDDDGALTLYIQSESPGPDLESNWLPAPGGPFYMLLRLYWPEDVVLDGRWTPPSVEKTEP